jgi:hypothetical protein
LRCIIEEDEIQLCQFLWDGLVLEGRNMIGAKRLLRDASFRATLSGRTASRGFKFTPLAGRVLVDLATTGRSEYDISQLSITRRGVIKP